METTSRTNPPTWALALVVPVVAVVAAVVTLTVTSDNSGNSGAAAKQGNAVTIENFAFSPTPLRVKAGTTVTVANQDHTAHTVTADNGAFDTGPIDSGTKKTITVGRPGRYAYHCEIHPFMTGRIEGDVNRTRIALAVGALAVLTSGWVHFYLYFRGGYRVIAPDSVLGITISRSFATNAIAGVVIAEALMLATRFEWLVLPAAAAGALFAAATITAFVISRADELLGFHEASVTTEAVVALVAEGLVLIALVPVVISSLKSFRRRAPVAA